jgi:hypothetical protein
MARADLATFKDEKFGSIARMGRLLSKQVCVEQGKKGMDVRERGIAPSHEACAELY